MFVCRVNVEAQVLTPFQVRYTANLEGDITLIGNSILTCSDSESRCAEARQGKGKKLNNNDFNMVYVDIDGKSETFNSSAATLNLPDGATVLFAGLYWGADTNGKALCTQEDGTSCSDAPPVAAFAAPRPDSRATILLKVPGTDDYNTLVGRLISPTSSNDYQAFIDITSLVSVAGNGEYTVANIQAATGYDRHGGWSLVIAYADSTEPARNLAIFDGYAYVDNRRPPVIIDVDGFITPPTGMVDTRLGIVAYEGDLGYKGDSLILNQTTMSNQLNPPDNFFNSTISHYGNYIENRNRKDINNFGFDVDLVDASDVLPNDAKSAKITLKSTSEQYYPGVVTFATELYAPKINAIKAMKNISRSKQNLPGDIIEYSILIKNVGEDRSIKTILTDKIPSHTTYVPNSLKIISGANIGSKTDALGDDQAEYSASNNSVVFRLGEGANSSDGGKLSVNSETEISFQVKVNQDAPDQVLIENISQIEYVGEILGKEISTVSNKVSFNLPNPEPPQFIPVKTQKNLTHQDGPNYPGDIIEYTIQGINTGQDAAYNTFIDDRIPEFTTYIPGSLEIMSGPNTGAKTDDAGDDHAEILDGNVRFRVGTGADSVFGGRFATDEESTIRFRVRINDGVIHNTTIDNLAYSGYRSETLDLPFVVPSNNTLLSVYNPIFPKLKVFKSFKSLTREVCVYMPGDIIQYSIVVENEGLDSAIDTILTDNIPQNTTYVPNSLRITLGDNTGSKTDQVRDDQAEYDSNASSVVFRLGSGANATSGGSIATKGITIITFLVRINDGVPDKTLVNNSGKVTAIGFTMGLPADESSNLVDFIVSNPPPSPCADIFIESSSPTAPITAGGGLNSVFKIKNIGPANATGVTFTVTLPEEIIADSVVSTHGNCEGTKTISCQIGVVETITTVSITINSTILPGAQPGVLTLSANVSAAECDDCIGNNANSWQVTVQNPQLEHCPKNSK